MDYYEIEEAIARSLQAECRRRFGSAWDIEIWKGFAWIAIDVLRPALKKEYQDIIDEALNDHADT